MFVSMKPGPTEFTRMPEPVSIFAACSVSIQTPAFDTPYAGAPGSGCFAAIDEIVTIAPPRPCSSIWRTVDCIDSNVPVRFTSSTACQSSSGWLANCSAGPAAARSARHSTCSPASPLR